MQNTTLLQKNNLRRIFLFMVAGTAAVTFLNSAMPAYAAEPVKQCDDANNVGGEAIECTVTVTNTVNLETKVSSAVVIIKNCVGAAGAELTCTTDTQNLQEAVTAVDQCNGSGNGGGGTVTCNVVIKNIISGKAAAVPATVNQCNGSGADGGTEPTLVCDPTGSTTNATVTQCNGSGNGGGGTERVLCTVGTSTQTDALPLTVNQCNGSGNGGGALVICSTRITNTITDIPEGGTPTTPPTTPPTTTPTTPPTTTPTTPATPGGGNDSPTPSTPANPSTPVTPAVPTTPNNTTVKDTPSSSATPAPGSSTSGKDDSGTLAYTGSNALPYAFGSAAIILLGTMLTVFAKKRV